MKTKPDAAKVLLEAGWTLEEIVAVVNQQPSQPRYVGVPVPFQPSPWWEITSPRLVPPYIITCETPNTGGGVCSGATTAATVSLTVGGKPPKYGWADIQEHIGHTIKDS